MAFKVGVLHKRERADAVLVSRLSKGVEHGNGGKISGVSKSSRNCVAPKALFASQRHEAADANHPRDKEK